MQEETPLRLILLYGWVERHSKVSDSCWSSSYLFLQNEKVVPVDSAEN